MGLCLGVDLSVSIKEQAGNNWRKRPLVPLLCLRHLVLASVNVCYMKKQELFVELLWLLFPGFLPHIQLHDLTAN